MMELGATICLPKAPLCSECPVREFCMTRGEHVTPPRAPQRSLPVAYFLDMRKQGTATEVLLAHRPADASLMPAMYELPSLPLESVADHEPVLRVRHAITNTNYYVQVYARSPSHSFAPPKRKPNALRGAVMQPGRELLWVPVSRLAAIPITGLARKILQRLNVMASARMSLLE
jgi:A/G-specific adenine glycosylase